MHACVATGTNFVKPGVKRTRAEKNEEVLSAVKRRREAAGHADAKDPHGENNRAGVGPCMKHDHIYSHTPHDFTTSNVSALDRMHAKFRAKFAKMSVGAGGLSQIASEVISPESEPACLAFPTNAPRPSSSSSQLKID